VLQRQQVVHFLLSQSKTLARYLNLFDSITKPIAGYSSSFLSKSNSAAVHLSFFLSVPKPAAIRLSFFLSTSKPSATRLRIFLAISKPSATRLRIFLAVSNTVVLYCCRLDYNFPRSFSTSPRLFSFLQSPNAKGSKMWNNFHPRAAPLYF